MTLSPKTLSLLDDLCFARANHCRVKELHRFGLMIRMHELRKFGLIEEEGYEPVAVVMAKWRERQTCAESQTEQKCLPEPPQPTAEDRGDGVARKAEEPSPMSGHDLVKLIEDFADEHPEISISRLAAHLFNSKSALGNIGRRKAVGAAIVARVRAVLSDPPEAVKREREARYPRKRSNFPHEPASRICPPASARLVDIKVNEDRDWSVEPNKEQLDAADRYRSRGAQHAAAVRRGQEAEATKLVDAGVDPNLVSSNFTANLMRQIIKRREDEARLADPIEQAKTLIRIRGWQCFSAVISGGPKGKYYIGNRLVDEAGLIAFAEDLRTRRRVG